MNMGTLIKMTRNTTTMGITATKNAAIQQKRYRSCPFLIAQKRKHTLTSKKALYLPPLQQEEQHRTHHHQLPLLEYQHLLSATRHIQGLLLLLQRQA
jgi:hypothetical protein